MYAAYALSALMTPHSPVDGLLAAGLVPALLSVLQTSRVCRAYRRSHKQGSSSSQHLLCASCMITAP